MAVYVDKSKNKFRNMIMCHMVADSIEELHLMALSIGMRKEWFQSDSSIPHYDVCLMRRKKAIELGAKEIDRKELVALIKKYRNSIK